MLKESALIISLVGIGVLLVMLNGSAYMVDNLNKTINNEKVIIYGKVVDERAFGSGKILKLNDGIELICDCYGWMGKNVSVEGVIDDFTGKKQVRVLRILEK